MSYFLNFQVRTPEGLGSSTEKFLQAFKFYFLWTKPKRHHSIFSDLMFLINSSKNAMRRHIFLAPVQKE